MNMAKKFSRSLGRGLQIALFVGATSGAVVWGAPPPAPPNETPSSETPPAEANAAAQPPGELGVIVAPTPGPSVLVVSTLPGTPAAQADLKRGDFILAVEGEVVASPHDLAAAIEKRPAGARVKLKVWRNGEELERQVTLAPRTAETRGAPRAWLGLELERENGRVVVDDVVPQSPAAEAGLRAEDVLLEVQKTPVRSIDETVQKIREMAPGDTVELKLERNGQAQTLTARLANLNERDAFYRPQFRPAERDEPVHPNMPMWEQRIERRLEELQRDIRRLEQQAEPAQPQEE